MEGVDDDNVLHQDKMLQLLLSRPLGNHSADDDDEETAHALLEEAQIEEEEGVGTLRHSYFQRTHSREVPAEISRSGRLYQTVQRSVQEYSRPTSYIKSQSLFWSSSPRPLPHPPDRSLMRLIPNVSPRPSSPKLTNSPSRKEGGRRLLPRLLRGSSG
ncbi:movement protein [Cotton bunchy top virus 2]|nr:movement protein [Cotton bunchy top virus 2]